MGLFEYLIGAVPAGIEEWSPAVEDRKPATLEPGSMIDLCRYRRVPIPNPVWPRLGDSFKERLNLPESERFLRFPKIPSRSDSGSNPHRFASESQ